MNHPVAKILPCILTIVTVASSIHAASVTVTIDFSKKMQQFDGWGTSLCWWAVRVGNWPEAKLRSLAASITDPDTGLGLTIFRYNIGGGENPAHTHMRAGGNVPGYKPGETAAYDWSADPNQRAMLKSLITACPKAIVEAFSNAPPWWMTKSGCSSGNTDGSNNLKDDYYDDFAAYLVEVVKHFQPLWNNTITTLEPLNESEATWWKANGSQEGCHFDRASQEKIIREVYNALKTAGLEKTIRISADDANSIDACLANLTSWTTETIACIGRINTHSYAGSKRAALRARADELKLPLYQSESGPLSWSGTSVFDAALFMSRRIIADLYEMKVQAWLDWQLMDESDTWQLYTTTWTGGTFAPATNFYARSGFSRFIRPGWSIVPTGNSDVAAAVAPSADSFGIVILNETTADKQYSFSISGIDTAIHSVEIYRTTASDRCILVKRQGITNAALSVTAPARSIISIRPQRPTVATAFRTPRENELMPDGARTISVSFNRATGALDISGPGSSGGIAAIYAVNGTAAGRINLPPNYRHIVDLSPLHAGVYIVSVRDQQGNTVRFRIAVSR